MVHEGLNRLAALETFRKIVNQPLIAWTTLEVGSIRAALRIDAPSCVKEGLVCAVTGGTDGVDCAVTFQVEPRKGFVYRPRYLL